MRTYFSILCVSIFCVYSSLVNAQTVGFEVDSFHPAPDRRGNYINVLSPLVMERGTREGAIIGSFADDLLVQDDTNGERLRSIVHSQMTMNLLGVFGIHRFFDLSVALPILVYRNGEAAVNLNQNSGILLSDMQIGSRLQLSSRSNLSTGLAFLANIPIGSRNGLTSNGLGMEARFSAEYELKKTRFATNIGYTSFLEAGMLNNLQLNDRYQLGFAADFPTGTLLRIVPEIVSSIPANSTYINGDHIATEARIAGKLFFDTGLGIEFGFGSGLTAGVSAPDWRVWLGVARGTPTNPDRDADGILNHLDACPDDPEDFDNFEDEDGCPDFDNDQDGILDTNDTCPDEPEDFDNFEDFDGCPDFDNDQDSILDENDMCPNEPEDFDGFEDFDGCPDFDNDQDTYLDPEDECPNFPEDFDGFEDFDGCPDPDNDQDGILDENDMCPNEPEVLNDVEDFDGCPDEGGEFELSCDGVELDNIYFVFDSSEIQQVSLPTLDRVANILRNAPYIHRMRIEGHTDSQGPQEYNMRLSTNRAEAVVTYIISRGIDPDRLSFEGFGETRLIGDERTWEGRYHNRRVGFIIIDQDRCRNIDEIEP